MAYATSAYYGSLLIGKREPALMTYNFEYVRLKSGCKILIGQMYGFNHIILQYFIESHTGTPTAEAGCKKYID
jgi:hypothetical protein